MRAEDRATIYPVWDMGKPGFLDGLASCVILATVLFNFILCIINTNFTLISNPQIIFCEVVLIITAFAIGFRKIDRAKLYWVIVLLIQVSSLLLLSVVKDQLLSKQIRDLIIMPVFIVLGLTANRVNFTKLLLTLSFFIAFIGLYEAIFAENFLRYVNMRKYYVSKGLFEDINFFGIDVIVSGVRPNAPFLINIPGLHRISSVFLEPVSLGFYAFISGLYFIAVKYRISRSQFYSGIVLSFLLIILSDARMAFGSMVIMLLFRPLFLRFDHRFSFLIFPVIFVIAVLVYLSGIFGFTGEGIGGRISWTMRVLAQTDMNILLGISRYKTMAEDSALAKLLANQGLLNLLVYWLAPIFYMRKASPAVMVYLFGLAVFISLGFMLSAAIFSIKTAGLLWYLYGYLIVRTEGDTMDDCKKSPKNLADLS